MCKIAALMPFRLPVQNSVNPPMWYICEICEICEKYAYKYQNLCPNSQSETNMQGFESNEMDKHFLRGNPHTFVLASKSSESSATVGRYVNI